MPVLDASHDLAHPVGDDSAWSESYYFNAYSPESDAGFFTRVGIRPNEGTVDGFVWAWLPDGGAAQLRFERPQTEMIDRVLEVGGVRFELVQPMQRWQLSARGEALDGRDLRFEATFDALTRPVGVDRAGQSPDEVDEATAAALRSVAGGHLEQAGRWTGWFEVDGQRVSLDGARGNRDKSWGPRRHDGKGGLRMWRWFSINIGDDTHFGGVRIGTPAGDLHKGWVWTDGEATSVKEWQLTTTTADDGIRHESLDLVAHDKRGREHHLHGDVLRAEKLGPAQPGTVLVYEGLTRWELDGRVGYGVSEYTHVLDDAGVPLVPVE